MIPNAPVSPPGPVSDTARDRPAAVPDRATASVPTSGEIRPGSSPPQPQRGDWGWLVTLLVVGALGYGGWHYQSVWRPWVSSVLFTPAKKEPPRERVIPVVTAVVQQRDMDLYLNGLGTVTALKTVTLRSRVEGELVKVTFTEGQMVKEGDLLVEIDSRLFEVQRDQAAGQLARDEALLNSAKLTLERMERLVATKSVTTQQVDDQKSIVQQTEGTIQTDRALVANAELQITYCKITAPISGRIGLRLVDAGNIVRANDLNGLAVITQLQPIALVFTIPQDDIPRVQKRMRDGHELTVDAYDRDFKTKLASGKLLATDNQVDPMTGTLRLKAIFDQEDNTLFPNQFVNTRLLVDTVRGAIVIPSAAVQRGPEFSFVYVARPEGTAELRKIEIGPVEGADTAITKGLSPGELVVTDGIDKLQDKAKISTRDPQAQAADSPRKKGEKTHGKAAEGSTADKTQGRKDAR